MTARSRTRDARRIRRASNRTCPARFGVHRCRHRARDGHTRHVSQTRPTLWWIGSPTATAHLDAAPITVHPEAVREAPRGLERLALALGLHPSQS